jgi:hypothetical protein
MEVAETMKGSLSCASAEIPEKSEFVSSGTVLERQQGKDRHE